MASVCMGIICSARRRFYGYQSDDYSPDEWFDPQGLFRVQLDLSFLRLVGADVSR